jgi:hypothetical protein
LGSDEAAKFRKLAGKFSTADVKTVFGVTDHPADQRIKCWRDLNLVKTIKHGKHEKLWEDTSGDELLNFGSQSSSIQ